MRNAAIILAFSALLPSWPGWADEPQETRLLGSWHLISFQIQIVGDEGVSKEVFGPHPFGRLVLTPEHTMVAYVSKPDREPPHNEADAAALLSSMIAYTGRYRLEGDKFITTVDGAWNEIYKAREQVRYFTLNGDRLSIRTDAGPSGVFPGKRAMGSLVWERER